MKYKYDNQAVAQAMSLNKTCAFSDYAHVFSRLANGDGQNKVLYSLLNEVCMLSYYSHGQPYGSFFLPMGATHTIRMDSQQYDMLASVVSEIEDWKIRARVADLLWCCGQECTGNKDIKYAIMACGAFAEAELNGTTWFASGLNMDWRRGLVLALSLGKAVASQYEKMQSRLKEALDGVVARKDTTDLLWWAIPSLLHEEALNKVMDAKFLAVTVEKLFQESRQKGESEFSVSSAARAASEWYKIAHDEISQVRMLVEHADSELREASSEIAKSDAQWFRAAYFCQSAMLTLQNIPSLQRGKYNVDDKIRDARILYERCCCNGQNNMRYAQTPSVDITKEVTYARNSVSGKTSADAIGCFVRLYKLTESDAERMANAFLNGSVVSALFAKSIVAHGRIVAHAPVNGPEGTDEHAHRLWVEKVQRAAYLIQVACHISLRPAYEVLTKEHVLTQTDFQKIVLAAPLIPATHKMTFATALYVGYKGFHSAATYMLAPEIENLIRAQLKQRGLETSTTDSKTKLQIENGLSTLIDKYSSEITDLFDADFLFELKAIFSDHAGPNVRNEIAHGLKDDSTLDGEVDFYVWWFALRLVHLRERRRVHSEKEGDGNIV